MCLNENSKMVLMSFVENKKTIHTIREKAIELGFELRKVRNKDLWDLNDNQTSGEKILIHVSLQEVYEYLLKNSDN